ncbi:MAG: hypothetical protein ABL999_04150 [Pyrinomonadaceae bacterium]
MKKATLILLWVSIAMSSSVPVFAQKTIEIAAKQTEKIRQKVAKIGTGDQATVKVHLFDSTRISGFISEANENTFVVMDASKKVTSLRYSDVESLDHSKKMGTKQKYIWAGVAAGVGTAIAIIAYGIFHRD